MTQWAEIRHLHLVEGVSKKQIARRLQLDIKTVRRALERLWCMAPDPYFGGHRQPAGSVAAASARSCL